MGRVEVRTAHRRVERENLGYKRQRRIDRFRHPATLVDFLQPDLASFRFGANRYDVPRIVANHVAAGYPGRQPEKLAAQVRPLYEQADFIEMAAGIRRANPVLV
jgi:hypothetical protein